MIKTGKKIISLFLVLLLMLPSFAVAGSFPATAAQATAKVDSYNVSISDSFDMHFQLSGLTVGSTLSYQVNDRTESFEVTASDMELTVPINSGEMTYDVELFEDGVRITGTNNVSWSIYTYILNLLYYYDMSKAPTTEALLHAILQYGAASQKLFNENTSKPANAAIGEITITDIDNEVPSPDGDLQLKVLGRLPGVSFYGTSVMMRSKLALRLYLTSGVTWDQTGYNIFIYRPGHDLYKVSEDMLVEKDGMYYVEIADMAPAEYADCCDLIISPADALELDESGVPTNTDQYIYVSYSPMHYICRTYHKSTTSEDMVECCQELYDYYLAALNYNPEELLEQAPIPTVPTAKPGDVVVNLLDPIDAESTVDTFYFAMESSDALIESFYTHSQFAYEYIVKYVDYLDEEPYQTFSLTTTDTELGTVEVYDDFVDNTINKHAGRIFLEVFNTYDAFPELSVGDYIFIHGRFIAEVADDPSTSDVDETATMSIYIEPTYIRCVYEQTGESLLDSSYVFMVSKSLPDILDESYFEVTEPIEAIENEADLVSEVHN